MGDRARVRIERRFVLDVILTEEETASALNRVNDDRGALTSFYDVVREKELRGEVRLKRQADSVSVEILSEPQQSAGVGREES